MDLLIAAHGVSLGAKLVSNSQTHFSRIEGRKTVNWSG
jgi:predicted nucleic acid-binding protein